MVGTERKILNLTILVVAVCALLQNTASEEVHVVGGNLGWTIPQGGAIVYRTWALTQHFNVGDILLFNFTNGPQDVAQVTKGAYKDCNTTDPISIKKTSPANFTLNATGDYYFTSTLDQHCSQGQQLAIHVPEVPGHSPSPAPSPREPLNYTVGGKLGWIVPPGGEIVYATWALRKTFIVGDSLVFRFKNGTQDVAVVTKEAFDKCETNNTIAVYKNSPTRIILNTTGEHFYTSTYPSHCELGQKLAINVTSNGTGALSPEGALSPTSALAPFSSAPSTVVCGYMFTFLSIALAFFN